MELSYATNEHSLFRKYAKLVTWYANHIYDEPIALWLPNGKILGTKGGYRMEVTTRAVNAPALYPALQTIDALSMYIESFKEAIEVFAWRTGLTNKMPSLGRAFFGLTLSKSPDANPETTTVDGRVGRNAAGAETWASIRDGSGDTANDSSTSNDSPQLVASATLNRWDELFRFIELYDTSALSGGADIRSATLRYYVNSKVTTLGSQSYRVVTSTPASNTALVNSDYAQLGTTAQASDVTLASVTTSAYNDSSLNATGLGNISKIGITKLGKRLVSDADNAEPTYGASQIARLSADNAGGSNPPILTIDYELGDTGYAYFM